MRGFWWFRDGRVAGMGRPGFNNVHWYDLPFAEAVLVGWVGRYVAGPQPIADFHRHLREYAPRIFSFHGLDQKSGAAVVEELMKPGALEKTGQSLAQRTELLQNFGVVGEQIHFTLNRQHLLSEIELLKQRGIRSVVTLTESANDHDLLAQHFEMHHFSIDDLSVPTTEQVKQVAEVLRRCAGDSRTVAVHCLAGIGRTSTMMIAAHVLLGENLEALKVEIRQRNPHFVLTGQQAKFIDSL